MSDPSPNPSPAPLPTFEATSYVRQTAALLGLTLPPELEAGVIANFEHICHIAQPLVNFPLPDDLESAATFVPTP